MGRLTSQSTIAPSRGRGEPSDARIGARAGRIRARPDGVVALRSMSHRGHATALASLPHRGRFGDPRPAARAGLPLPPAAMPSRLGTRPLKAWRYVGVFGTDLMACVATVRIG